MRALALALLMCQGLAAYGKCCGEPTYRTEVQRYTRTYRGLFGIPYKRTYTRNVQVLVKEGEPFCSCVSCKCNPCTHNCSTSEGFASPIRLTLPKTAPVIKWNSKLFRISPANLDCTKFM